MDNDQNKMHIEVGAIWISETAKHKAILGIKIDRTGYVAFKNANKSHDDMPDYFVYKHQGRHPLTPETLSPQPQSPQLDPIGGVWRRYNQQDVHLLLKINDEYFYAFPRLPDDTNRGAFAVIAYREQKQLKPLDLPDTEQEPAPANSKTYQLPEFLQHG